MKAFRVLLTAADAVERDGCRCRDHGVRHDVARGSPATFVAGILVVSAPTADGWRGVVEVFELANDSSVTLVSRVGIGDRPSWSVAAAERCAAVAESDRATFG